MIQRIVAYGLLAAVLGFIALLASVTFFVRDPLPILSPRAPIQLATREITPAMGVQLALDGGYVIEVQVQHPDHETPPQIGLRPAGGAEVPLEIQTTGPRHLIGAAQLTRPGRWEVVLREASPAGQTTEIRPFIVQE